MPLAPSWDDIALRLFLTCIACGAIGLDRGGDAPPLDLIEGMRHDFTLVSFELAAELPQ